MFELISKVAFFKNHIIGRAFRRWHKGVRQANFRRIRKRVEESLFLGKPAFLPFLSEIYKLVHDVQSVAFSWANHSHLYTLQEYADIQGATRDQKAKPALEAIAEAIQKVLERACKEVQRQAKLYQDSVRDEAELRDFTGVELFTGRGAHRPMVVIKKEKQDRAYNYGRVMRELTMLGAFIRLADYMYVEAVIQRATDCVDDTYALLNGWRAQGDKAKGVFLSTIGWSPDGSISFLPNESSIMDEIINHTVEGVITLANGAPRLLFMRLFSQYFDGRPSGLNVNNIVRQSPQMVALRTSISEAIKADFLNATEYVKVRFFPLSAVARSHAVEHAPARRPLSRGRRPPPAAAPPPAPS